MQVRRAPDPGTSPALWRNRPHRLASPQLAAPGSARIHLKAAVARTLTWALCGVSVLQHPRTLGLGAYLPWQQALLLLLQRELVSRARLISKRSFAHTEQHGENFIAVVLLDIASGASSPT